jgi:hypothetical protein
MNTRTYSLFSITVSTCRKSTARIPAARMRRNWRQLEPEGRGAGSMPAACRISPDGGRRHGDAELHQLALDPAMAPQRILPRQAQYQSLDTRVAGGRPGLRRPLVSYFLAASLRCQARSVAGVTGTPRPSAGVTRSVPARRTRPGPPGHTACRFTPDARLPPRPRPCSHGPRSDAHPARPASPENCESRMFTAL